MNTLIITIDGTPGSGKSMFAEGIKANIADCLPDNMKIVKVTVYEEPYTKLVIDWQPAA